MNRKRMLIILASIVFFTIHDHPILAQENSALSANEDDNQSAQHSIGSTVFLLGNLAPGKPPHFFLLNYGYRLSRNDIIFAEAITWTYYEPLGSYGSSEKLYPGKIIAYGMGVGYQRFVWKSLYVTAQATPFYQQFYNEQNARIANGLQLYLQSRLGYRFEFFKHRWYVEPSIAFNYWPVNTDFPDTFAAVESGKANYFLFEPGLHFGYKL